MSEEASPDTMIIISSCLLFCCQEKGQPVAPACPRALRAAGAAAPVVPAPLPMNIVVNKTTILLQLVMLNNTVSKR